jgi:hypothetical protein
VQGPLESTDEKVQSILPALRTFPTGEVAIIGCHSSKIARNSCEYDLLMINRDPIPEKIVSVGESYAKLMFRSEREVKQPTPQLALALATAVPLRDNSLLLASAISDCKRTYKANTATLMERHLAESLKAVGRVDELLSAGEAREADFWLMSAACDYASAVLLNADVSPAPSHILAQFKSIPRKKRSKTAGDFRAWSEALGLELASKASCENRLEALSVVYDVLRTSAVSPALVPLLGRYADPEAFMLVKIKAEALLGSMQAVECFSYLGTEAVSSVLDLYSLHAAKLSKERDLTSTIRDLTVGEDRLISEEVLKSLGLVRSIEMLRHAKDVLKTAVSQLAKKI